MTNQFNHVSVKSSMIRSVAYDVDSETLEVCFCNGGAIYRYPGVPKQAYDTMLSADSVGSYFAKNIRNTYKGIRYDYGKHTRADSSSD